MRSILILFLAISLFMSAEAQVITGMSKTGYVNITKEPPKPPYLEVKTGSLRFTDQDGNRKIDANEMTSLQFDLTNTGMGPGLNLVVKVSEQNRVPGLTFNQSISLGVLETGSTIAVDIPLTASMTLTDGKALFLIYVDEANGFDSDPVQIEVETQAFIPPALKIVDYRVTSQQGTTLQKRKPFDLQVLVQNTGQGDAQDVRLELPVPENIFCLSSNISEQRSSLGPGEEWLLEYSLVTNNEYTSADIPFRFKLTEKYGSYSEDKTITLSLNQAVSTSKMVVQGESRPQHDITIGSLVSPVDRNIPVNSRKYPNRVALIIGNEDYSGTLNAEANVDYAVNDAEAFRQYAIQTLGVQERNMHFLVNATAGQMRREMELVTELVKRLGSDAELIFYYAGHGYPDESTRIPYLIPVDVDASHLGAAIRIEEVYRKFGSTGAGRIVVFLDACFSGGGRNQGLLAARSALIEPEQESLSGHMVVFSASSGQQSALPLHNEKHGIFTYYLLKKLQERQGNVSLGELASYLKHTVGVESLRANGRPQDPEVNTSQDVQDSWEGWMFVE